MRTWYVEDLDELPEVEFRDVYVDGELASNFRAIVNTENKMIYDIVSKRYEIVPHRAVVEFVRESLEELGYEPINEVIAVSGRGARLFYSVIVDEDTINGDDMNFGIMATNSYDRSVGLSCAGYGFRIACHNQMIFGKEILRLWAPHTKSLVAENLQKLREMIATVVSGVSELKDLVAAAQKDLVSATELAEFIEKLGVSKKMKEKIAAKVKEYTGFDFAEKLDAAMAEKALINRWMAYNALTDALTHETKHMEMLTVYNLQKKVSQLLVGGSGGVQTLQAMQ